MRTLDYHPNADAARWLVSPVLPAMRPRSTLFVARR
jgi:hypothetical protein